MEPPDNPHYDSNPPHEAVEQTDHSSKKFPWKYFIKCILIGYVIGLIVTIAWFVNYFPPTPCLKKKSTLTVLVLLLLYGCLLLFSRNVRCTSMLMLPILCSSKGQAVLIAFAIVLAATGPSVNILKNVDILTKSISCGQEQLKGALEKMLDLVKRPLVAVKNAVKIAMAELKKVLKEVEVVLLRLRGIIVDILNAIKKAFDWLGNVVSMCNKELGTPFDRCIKLADESMEDCKKEMGIFDALCNVTKVFRALCYSVKFIDAICVLVEFISDSVILTVTEKLEKFASDIKTMFYVSVKFDQQFRFKTIATKNFTTIGGDILSEIRAQMEGFFILFGWVEFVGSFMVFLVVLKALLYKHKYLQSDRFDNYFITHHFKAIDTQRERMGKEQALPLTRKERRKYVIITSPTLVRAEILKMSRKLVFLIIPTVQLLCICLTDYSLYWLLSMILFYGRQEAGLDVPPYITVNISGGGYTADIFKGIVHAFEPMKEKYEIDPRPCLPVPRVPNFRRYWEIGILVVLAWVCLMCKPYGLRLRQVVMAAFYPERAQQRALWLYNQILMKRTSFIKFARRRARRKFLKDSTIEVYTCKDWLRAKTDRFWIFRKLLGTGKSELCNICGTPLKGDDSAVYCQQMGCKGMYCAQCYAELENKCCLCQKPVDYGDLSDISEEKDSSDELEEVRVTEDDEFCSSQHS